MNIANALSKVEHDFFTEGSHAYLADISDINEITSETFNANAISY